MRIAFLFAFFLAGIAPVAAQTIYVVQTNADGTTTVREFGGMPLATVKNLMSSTGADYSVVDKAAYDAAIAALPSPTAARAPK